MFLACSIMEEGKRGLQSSLCRYSLKLGTQEINYKYGENAKICSKIVESGYIWGLECGIDIGKP